MIPHPTPFTQHMHTPDPGGLNPSPMLHIQSGNPSVAWQQPQPQNTRHGQLPDCCGPQQAKGGGGGDDRTTPPTDPPLPPILNTAICIHHSRASLSLRLHPQDQGSNVFGTLCSGCTAGRKAFHDHHNSHMTNTCLSHACHMTQFGCHMSVT